jgi:hypothetical protein
VFEDVLKRALIMLQATSALDSVSERLVQGALDRLMKVRAITLLHVQCLAISKVFILEMETCSRNVVFVLS